MGCYGDELLIEYALMCQVKELIVISSDYPDPRCYDVLFISQHLKILEFWNVTFEGPSVDFSNCPVLEDLTMGSCCIDAPSICSKTLKRLCITGSCTFPVKFRISIVAPDLISLVLDHFSGLTPSLGYMPFLLSAYVGLRYRCHDFCKRMGQNCGDHECGCHAYPADEGVLMNRLSNAVKLELIATRKMVRLQLTPFLTLVAKPKSCLFSLPKFGDIICTKWISYQRFNNMLI
jgi:hypothetical protein